MDGDDPYVTSGDDSFYHITLALLIMGERKCLVSCAPSAMLIVAANV